MELPLPQDRWVDCVWLPRIIAKARALQRGELPAEYVERFCHANGVDGQFLAHFGFTREEILAAAALADAEAQAWFRQRTTPEKIAAWNHTALNLGRPGFPLAERLPVALATTYKHLAHRGFTTVFEVLAADEAEG